jgi:hypothetical protein
MNSGVGSLKKNGPQWKMIGCLIYAGTMLQSGGLITNLRFHRVISTPLVTLLVGVIIRAGWEAERKNPGYQLTGRL